jgi:hypothetical protein
MKKTLIAVAAAAALATTSAFAEITFGAWVKGVLVPVAYDGVDTKAGLTQSWGGAARTGAISINGVTEDEKAGFTFDVRDEAGTGITKGDRSVLWVKPIDMLKLSVGAFDGPDNGFRQGSGTFGIHNYLRSEATFLHDYFLNGDDAIMDGKAGDGLIAELTPIEGLKIMANIPFLSWSGKSDAKLKEIFGGENEWKVATNVDVAWVVQKYLSKEESIDGGSLVVVNDAYDVYRYFQLGAAYTIDGIGTAKVLWTNTDYKVTDGTDDYNYYGNLGVAFDLTAVENLYVAIGVKQTIGDKEAIDTVASVADNGFRAGTQIAVDASYNVLDNLTVHAAGGVFISSWSDIDPVWGVAVGADYGVLDNVVLNADVRYAGKVKADDETLYKDAFEFLVGAKYIINSNASISAGFEGVTNGWGLKEIDAGTKKSGKVYEGLVWAIPVVFELSL